jgi:hypothetical protein
MNRQHGWMTALNFLAALFFESYLRHAMGEIQRHGE